MRRRDFLVALATTTAWSPRARAQQDKLPIVACLAAPAEANYTHHVTAVRQGLKETGLVEGQNFRMEFRWADGQYERLPAMAEDLVNRKVSVILTMGGGPPIQAAKAATSTIPVIFHLGADPVQTGLVKSFNRPGGNITGVTLMTNSMEPKRIDLLQKMIPNAKIIGVLANPANLQNEIQLLQLQGLAAKVQLRLETFTASDSQQLEATFHGMAGKNIEALTVLSDVFSPAIHRRLPRSHYATEFQLLPIRESFRRPVG